MQNIDFRYSVHGSHILGNRLRVYHQGGLDTYCGFYAILNLINFIKYRENLSNDDYIGACKFREFIRFIDTFDFDGPFPKRPFGDYGLTQTLLKYALSRALKYFKIDARVDVGDILPATAAGTLGIAAVEEGGNDDLGHWVTFVGKDFLNDLNDSSITCESDWNEIVLTPTGDTNAGLSAKTATLRSDVEP